jgi:hypothetical protein
VLALRGADALMTPVCFFAHLGNCQGRLVRAHLIPKQRIKREVQSRDRQHPPLPMNDVIWDPRCWTWMCGGYGYGNAGHHGRFDAKQLRIPRYRLPEGVEEFAEEYGLVWSLDRDYGSRV